MHKKQIGISIKHHIHPATLIVREEETVEEALASLRQKKYEGKILYFYVVDKEHHLHGIASTRALLLAEPTTKVADIMEESIFYLKEDDTFEKAVIELSAHRLLALPVIDDEGRLKGVVDIQMCLDENIDLFKEQRNQDVFQLVGMTLEEGAQKSSWHSYRKRMPWILCNMIGGIACAIISSIFKLVLGQVLILAMFIPLVLSLSESISMQSMTQSFQILRKQHISMSKILLRMFSEVRVGILMAITSGLLVGLIALFWDVSYKVVFTMAAGVIVSVTFSSLIGASIPLILHIKKLDPKVASGPVVLTFADMFTTSVYLAIATWWLI